MRFLRINSPNFSKKTRKSNFIQFLIIHYTGMQSTRESIKRLISKKHKVSCHYLIDLKGNVIQMVDDNKVAWHAGKSKWKNFKNLNKNSIGIELENKGHKLGYKNFPKNQINKLIKLCFKLKKKYKVKNNYILGHSDIAPLRKLDPGEKFPWLKLKTKGLGIWYSSNKSKNTFKNFSNIEIRNRFFKNLYKIGYRYFKEKKISRSDKFIVKSFQRRFRQSKVNGQIDLECLKISDNLAKNNKI